MKSPAPITAAVAFLRSMCLSLRLTMGLLRRCAPRNDSTSGRPVMALAASRACASAAPSLLPATKHSAMTKNASAKACVCASRRVSDQNSQRRGMAMQRIAAARRGLVRRHLLDRTAASPDWLLFRCSARRRKCRLVRSFRIVPHTAMPIAPPRLRIRLNRPDASFSRSGASPPKRQRSPSAPRRTAARSRGTPAAAAARASPSHG